MNEFYDTFAQGAAHGWLPPIFEHAFVVRAFVAALLIGPLLGAMGTVVVAKRLVFFTQALGHASLTGVALGLLLGEPLGRTYAGLYGFTALLAIAMLYGWHRLRASSDIVVGVVLAQVLGLGIVLMVAVTQQFDVHAVEAVLFGSLITLSDIDLALLTGTTLVIVPLLAMRYNRLLLGSFNLPLARARGVDTTVEDYIFVLALTFVVVAGLKVAGALLVLVLIVLPAAAAQNLAQSMVGFFWWSVVFGLVAAVGGLALSIVWPMPTGGGIVLAASGVFYSTLLLRSALGPSVVRQT